MDPIIKMNALKYSTALNLTIGFNTKYVLIDLRNDKKRKLDKIVKQPIIEFGINTSKDVLTKLLINNQNL